MADRQQKRVVRRPTPDARDTFFTGDGRRATDDALFSRVSQLASRVSTLPLV